MVGDTELARLAPGLRAPATAVRTPDSIHPPRYLRAEVGALDPEGDAPGALQLSLLAAAVSLALLRL